MNAQTVTPFVAPRYAIQKKLGAGGMGVVYHALDQLMQQSVAIKQLQVPIDLLEFMSKSSSDNIRLSLAREFQFLASLRHPHIVKVFDYGFTAEKSPFLVMEYLENAQPLISAFNNGSVEEKIQALLIVLGALQYLHRRGIVHRDLKPENVLVSHGQVKVLDFGLSIQQGQLSVPEGTLAYMAPELFAGHAATQSSDLYAVGVLAYELFAGKLPYMDSDVERMIENIGTQSLNLAPLDAPSAVIKVIERLLAKDPQQRFQEAGEVIASLSQATQIPIIETQFIRDSFLQAARFVGRKSELERLSDALTQLEQGHGSGWLIRGESGVGKSRLLDEVRISAMIQGKLVLRGQAAEGGGLPYQIWRDPLQTMILSASLTDLEIGILKTVVPNIEQLSGRNGASIPGVNPKTELDRLNLLITDLFQRHQQPIVLILEDLQWAQDSLEPLQLLLQDISEKSLMVIASYRTEEQAEIAQTLPSMEVLSLQRLTDREIAELGRSILGEADYQLELTTLLIEETEGNVLFILEVLRTLAANYGRLSDIAQNALPEQVTAGGVIQVLLRRLQRLPVWALKLVQLSSVHERRIDLRLLAEMTQENLEAWIDVCANAAVLDYQDGYWRFAHDKLREAVLQNLESDTLKSLHRHLAEAIEKVYPEDKAYVDHLATHWRNAGDVVKERLYLSKAAERRLELGSPKSAEVFIRRALEIEEAQTQKAYYYRLLANALRDQGSFAAALDAYQTASELAKASGDEQIFAESLLGHAWTLAQQGEFASAKTELAQCLQYYERVQNDPGIADTLHVQAIIARQEQEWKLFTQCVERSISIYRQINNLHGIAVSLNSLGAGAYFQGELDEARRYFQESLDVHIQIGDKRNIGLRLGNLGAVALQQGQMDQAARYYEQAYRAVREVGDKAGMARILWNLGTLSQNLGRYADARHYFERSLPLARARNEKAGIAANLSKLAVLAANDKDYETALQYNQESIQLYEELNDPLGLTVSYLDQGRVHIMMQNFALAETALAQSLSIARRIEDADRTSNTLQNLVELEIRKGNLKTAVGYLVEAIKIARDSNFEIRLLSVFLTAANLLHADGDHAEAVKIMLYLQNQPTFTPEEKLEIKETLPAIQAKLSASELVQVETSAAGLEAAQLAEQLLERFEQRAVDESSSEGGKAQ
jgi:serine/threonine protein kinase/tetratricopeptide (TPR) repeat protein